MSEKSDQQVVEEYLEQIKTYGLKRERVLKLEYKRNKAELQLQDALKNTKSKFKDQKDKLQTKVEEVKDELSEAKQDESVFLTSFIADLKSGGRETQDMSSNKAFIWAIGIVGAVLISLLSLMFARTWELKSGVEANRTSIEAKLTTVNSEIAKLSTETANLKTTVGSQVSTAIDAFKSSQKLIVDAGSNANEASRKLLEANINAAFDKQFAAVENQLKKIEQHGARVETAIGNLSKRDEALKKSLDAIQASVDKLLPRTVDTNGMPNRVATAVTPTD